MVTLSVVNLGAWNGQSIWRVSFVAVVIVITVSDLSGLGRVFHLFLSSGVSFLSKIHHICVYHVKLEWGIIYSVFIVAFFNIRTSPWKPSSCGPHCAIILLDRF